MKNKFLKASLVSCFLAISSYAHASFIDNGDFTTDTSSGLDWLDWVITDNMSGTTALEITGDWRYATAIETYNLLGSMGFGLGGSPINSLSGYQVQYEKFAKLFGLTFDNDDGYAVWAQVKGAGLYGVYRSPHNETDKHLYFGYDPTYYDAKHGRWDAGVALVRRSVPEPSTLAILALGVLAPVFRRFKKYS